MSARQRGGRLAESFRPRRRLWQHAGAARRSLEVRKAEIVALVGSNGAGKTTLLRALSRVIGCTGSIEFAGRDLVPLTPEQAFGSGLVQVPEGRQLFDRMTVEDNLHDGRLSARRQGSH